MRIAVYITSYNQRELLRDAIESVLNQTLPPTQIIVVDDASTDDSQDLIADYARRHLGLFTPIYHESNTGVARARIDALQAVSADYVTYVDGDDRFLPQKLEREAAALTAHPEASIAFSNNRWVRTDGRSEQLWIVKDRPPEGVVLAETFARRYPRRRLFRMELVRYADWQKVGFHDSRLVLLEDWDMRIRLTHCCRTVYVDEILSEVRVHFQGLSQAGAVEYFRAVQHVIKKNRPLLNDLPPARRRWAITHLRIWIVSCVLPGILVRLVRRLRSK